MSAHPPGHYAMATQTAEQDTVPEAPIIIEEKVIKADGEVATRSYQRGKLLGKGGFARCYEFTSLETGIHFAAKIVPKLTLKKARSKQKLMSEIKIHRTAKHTNIVNFEHFFEDSENVCSNKSPNFHLFPTNTPH